VYDAILAHQKLVYTVFSGNLVGISTRARGKNLQKLAAKADFQNQLLLVGFGPLLPPAKAGGFCRQLLQICFRGVFSILFA